MNLHKLEDFPRNILRQLAQLNVKQNLVNVVRNVHYYLTMVCVVFIKNLYPKRKSYQEGSVYIDYVTGKAFRRDSTQQEMDPKGFVEVPLK